MSLPFRHVRQSLRRSGRHGAATALCIATLGLGIGATTAGFSLLRAVVSHLPPLPDPERIARVFMASPSLSQERGAVSPRELTAWSREVGALEGIAGFVTTTHTVTGGDEPRIVATQAVSPGYFRVLGVRPARGRDLAGDEHGAPPAVISHGFWARRLGGDDDALGRTLVLSGEPHVVVGVMPEGFWFPAPGIDLWTRLAPADPLARDTPGIHVVARLSRSATWSQAREQLAVVSQRLRSGSEESAPWSPRVEPLAEAARKRLGLGAAGLLGPPLVVLLVACADVAGVLLVQMAAREREIALRAALGASRGRLFADLVAENVPVALGAGALGLPLAVACVYWFRAHWAAIAPELAASIRADRRVAAVALLSTALTPLLFGVLPALHAVRRELVPALRGSWMRPIVSGTRFGTGDLLVAGEVAASVALVVTSALFLGFFRDLGQVDRGFDPRGVVAAGVPMTSRRHSDDAILQSERDRMLAAIRALPGVTAAAAADRLPRLGRGREAVLTTGDGSTPRRVGYEETAVSPGYFATLGIPLIRGRPFTSGDGRGAPPVVILSGRLAERLWPAGDPIGRTLRPSAGDEWMTVVGVAADVMQPRHAPFQTMRLYRPLAQAPRRDTWLLARTADHSLAVAGPLKRAVWSVDADQAVAAPVLLETELADELRDGRLMVGIIAGFACLALALAVVGVYAVMRMAVQERRREAAVRRALGATAAHILRLGLGRALAVAAVGAAVGLTGTLSVTRTLWYELLATVGARMELWALVALLLGASALAAAAVPARDAIRLEPMRVLRE